MNVIVSPSPLSGTVRVPPSKSAAHRALICAALADGETQIGIGALNRDIEATIDCLRALGATIDVGERAIRVQPVARVPDDPLLDCGESGSTLRFMLPVAAALGARARLVGHGRLPERPNKALTEALRAHGAAIDADLLPIQLSGSLGGGIWALPGDISSQYITGLLFALPLLVEDSEILLTTRLESAAYVEMTLQALRQFGVRVEATPSGWRVPGGQRYHTPGRLEIEGDWSAAAFWLAANRLGGDIRLEGLREDTCQGDRAALTLLGQAEINIENVPDLAPALAVAAASLPQVTRVTGAARLRLKESDRLQAIAQLLDGLGHGAEALADGLVIHGGPPAPCEGNTRRVNGVNDHRIVMAAAVAAAYSDVPVLITDAQAVDKSYPDFFRDFTRLGGKIDVEPSGQ